MTQTSPHLNLPYIQPAQAQKHATHNEAIERLDTLAQLSVKAVENTPPTDTVVNGENWIVGTAPLGAWAGKAQNIATWHGTLWEFITPKTGWRAYDIARKRLVAFNGTSWEPVEASTQNRPGLGINASWDSTNKLSIASDATLFNHNGTSHQLKLNKASSSATASTLYQSNWSARAEVGLLSNNSFTIKVSDGATWTEALAISDDSGTTSIKKLLNLKPQPQPSSAAAGDVYFDNTTNKLRCFDGTAWNNLW